MFNILDLTLASLLKDNEDDLLTFGSGNEAKEYINKIQYWSDHKFQPRKALPGDDKWKEREASKYETGEYTKVEALEKRNLTKPEHFVHMSKKGGVNLAYTKNEEKGRANVQTAISFRGYLETFFRDVVTDDQIEEIKEEQEALVFGEKLKFATTPEDIEQVYINFDPDCESVAGSCMRLFANDYAGVHPCRVYGAGDLAVAYLVNDDRQTTHRALVWPEKKLYSRVYGGNALHNLLKKVGYSKSRYYGSEFPSMEGARILRINHPKDPKRVIMPYIDEKANVTEKDGDEQFFYFTLDNGIVDPHETQGSSYKYTIKTCARCDTKDKDHRFCSVVVSTDLENTADWCSDCARRYAFTDFTSQLLYCNKNFKQITVSMFHPYSREPFDAICEENTVRSQPETYLFCAYDPTRAMIKEFSVEVSVSGGEIELWCKHSADKHAWKCQKSGKYFSQDVEIFNVQVGVSKRYKSKLWERWSHAAAIYHANTVRDRWNRRLYISKAFEAEFIALRDAEIKAGHPII